MRLPFALGCLLSLSSAPFAILLATPGLSARSWLDGIAPAATVQPATGAATGNASTVALVNVNVVPMDRERVLTDQTVIVRGDRIVTIGPAASTKAPEGSTVVEARGKYLMPGLAEMHAHLVSGGPNANPAAIEALNARILFLNVMHGVTTVRGMLGHPTHLDLRARVAKGDLVGPTIYTSGPSFNGNSAPTPDVAVKMVREQKAAGYDFLKIHPGLSRATFDAMAATADKVGIRFAGHVPADVGLARALEARYATIDHLDGYVEALAADELAAAKGVATRPAAAKDAQSQAPQPQAPPPPPSTGFFGSLLMDSIDESKIPALVAATRKAGVAIVPTETVVHAFLDDTPPVDMARRPEMALMPATMVAGWMGQKQKFNIDPGLGTPTARAKFFGVRAKLLKALQASGVTLLLGADSPQVFCVPGHAAHQELQLMVQAGLTPYQALEAGTRNVAEFFGTSKERGTLAANRLADAVLVDGNPLTDVANASKVSGVLLRGRWLPRAELEKQLETLMQQKP